MKFSCAFVMYFDLICLIHSLVSSFSFSSHWSPFSSRNSALSVSRHAFSECGFCIWFMVISSSIHFPEERQTLCSSSQSNSTPFCLYTVCFSEGGPTSWSRESAPTHMGVQELFLKAELDFFRYTPENGGATQRRSSVFGFFSFSWDLCTSLSIKEPDSSMIREQSYAEGGGY